MNGPNSTQFATTELRLRRDQEPGNVRHRRDGSDLHHLPQPTQPEHLHVHRRNGYYQTMFFLRGYYNPSTGGNNAAQFCRQCHGGEANE